ncbi:MAG: transketolase family protein [Thermoplasmata archaeon]|nr:transketolase family protein [Thermoplasmata archaeon]
MTNLDFKKASQRKAFGEALVELGKENPNVVVLAGDLASSTKTNVFEKAFPERHFNFGIAEENMMGAAAGLAISGKIVFASTFSVFATARAYDHVRQSIAYTRANVKIVATHAGITVGGDGATHQMAEDLALMMALPNFTVVVPADAVETKKAIKAAAAHQGPVYIRLGRTDFPVVTRPKDPFEIGKATVLRRGRDVTLIGTGIMVSVCLEAAEVLASHGISARVINMSTIKPMDQETIIKAARETGAVVTAEEHNVEMGMGSAIAMVLAEHRHVPMKRVGIPDVFGESGESDELMEKYGLTVDNIVDAARDVLKRKDKIRTLSQLKKRLKKMEAELDRERKKKGDGGEDGGERKNRKHRRGRKR